MQQQAEHVNGIKIIRILSENLSIDPFGIAKLSGAMVRNAALKLCSE